MTITEATQATTIAQLNDRFRQGDHTLGQVYTTQLVQGLSSEEQQELFRLVRTFDDFNLSNDPRGEHNFGRIKFKGEVFNFKIDYYSPDLIHGSEDPEDLTITIRVLTLMHSSEY
ncbi:DUF3768 domain-containing protein [Acaryochloris marina]|uniref:DUF3768 domain-containing protein n=1 Tax=Acaryochloris marina (strain MBIC 11017) TaxID=329726 RepID=A8ZPZ4_ACAM1|nr:DUF3768 domain-containing protein [Acaryochloris marina]ABW33171.1 conserved hypothetical protein [Acaryochloris marina MBIC11017]BDM83220.1 hypothetical protein AM10699_60810 [Acaryochloris marina MBIC10699]